MNNTAKLETAETLGWRLPLRILIAVTHGSARVNVDRMTFIGLEFDASHFGAATFRHEIQLKWSNKTVSRSHHCWPMRASCTAGLGWHPNLPRQP